MSSVPKPPPAGNPAFATARQRRLQRTLEHYGVLTRQSLRDLAGASRWKVPFDVVLTRAIRAGRVRALGSELLEPPTGRPPDAAEPDR